MGVPRGRVKLIAAGTVTYIVRRRFAREGTYTVVFLDETRAPCPQGELSEKVLCATKKQRS